VTRPTFPSHRVRPLVVLGLLGTGLVLALYARTTPVGITAAVLCLGAGCGLVAMGVLDYVRGPKPTSLLGRLFHFALRVPVFLMGAGAVLLGPVVIAAGVWSVMRGHTAAGVRMGVLGILLVPTCTGFGVHSVRASMRRTVRRGPIPAP